jgi:hypothetical protein
VSYRVRVAPEFFFELDAQLSSDRSRVIPSRSGFQTRELCAGSGPSRRTGTADAPLGPEHYRLLIVAGHLVRAISVTGRLVS